MTKAISGLAVLLRSMEPTLHAGVYAYCVVPHGTDVSALSPVASVSESEGLTSRSSSHWSEPSMLASPCSFVRRGSL